jgi:site-specific DNA-methyltransferase (adenine-specific)
MSHRVEELADGVTLHLGDAREIVPTLPIPGTLTTDPPYGMAFRSNHRAVKHSAIANDADEGALVWACSVPVLHSRYVFCRWDNLVSVPKPKSMVTWVKNNWSMGDLEHEHGRQTEVALFYPGPEHRFPKGRPNDVIIAPRTGNEHHPTEKPVQLMLNVLEWTEGTVLDPFCGSGTTGVAAARLGRPFVGIELDQKHFDTACRRLERAISRPDMFAAARPSKPVQEALL